jgi:sugar phosphate isomerase/epimerase
MRFGISTQIYRKRPLTRAVLECIRKGGYERIELFCNRPHLDFHDRSLLRDIGRWFDENALPAPSIHLPFVEHTGKQKIWISPLDPDKGRREWALDEIKRALELAERVPPEYVVLHFGNPGQEFHSVVFDHAYTLIAQIRSFSGVRVIVENIPNEISTIERIKEFKEVAGVPDIGICYDTGHSHLLGTNDALDNIDTTHIHDNNGVDDEHLWPFQGTMNWPALIEKLVRAEYKGPFIFEARGENLDKGAEARARLEDLWGEAHNSLEEFRLKYGLNDEG